MMQYNMQ